MHMMRMILAEMETVAGGSMVNIDPFILFLISMGMWVILLILLIVLWRKHNELNKKYGLFMRGRDAKTLEDDIFKLFEDNDQIRSDIVTHRKEL